MKTSPDFLVAIAERLGWALLHSLWQGAIVAVVLAFALHLMRRRSAAVRHAMCLLAMLVLVVSVMGTAWIVRPAARGIVQSSRLDSVIPIAAASAPASVRAASTLESPNVAESMEAAAIPVSWRERFEPALPVVSAVWILGVTLLSLRHLAGWRKLNALRSRGGAARWDLEEMFQRLLERFGWSGGVRLLESAEAAVPMLTGFLKPAVLLPMSVISGLSAREIEAILAHELAHLLRRDAWSNLAQLAVETLFFYHPAVWWIGRRVREEREIAADDLALRVCSDRRIYAGALARLAELNLAPTAALAANGGGLLARIQRILRPAPVETLPSGWSRGVPTLLMVLALAAVFRTHADDAKPVEAPAKPDAKELAQKSATDAKAWLADAFQLDDKAKREAAIERIRAAMTGGNAEEARTGVTAFVQLGAIEFDKTSFRPAVRALLASEDAVTRAAAVGAFSMTGAEPDDLPRLYALADDAADEVRARLTSVIVQLNHRELRDTAASNAILKLMANLPRDSRSVAHSLWGVNFSREIEARVLEFCRDIDAASNSSVGYNFFYGALSTQANKSKASCKRLIELLAHPDTTNIAGRSAWGLQQGVAPAQSALVAETMVKVLETRSDGYLRENALRCLRAYGDEAQVPALKAMLAKPGVTGDFREALEETLAAMEARPSGETARLASNTFLEAYLACGDGEKREAAGDKAGALASWKRAISLLDHISREHPVWKADMVKRRRELSAKAVARLDLGTSEAVAPSPAPPTALPIEKAEIEVEWNGKWWPATVLKKDGEKTQIHYVGYGSEWDEWVIPERVRPIAVAAVSTETPSAKTEDEKKKEEEDEARRVEKNRQAARLRAADDRQTYQAAELAEIESLYQVANKNWRTEEARTSLKKLLEKFDRANRTGCATLYMGQMSEGQERLDYLTRAVEKFSDCYYLDGCQVGGYGRYVLALTLWDQGEKEKARALLAELKTSYQDATDHKGRPMSEVAQAAEKELAAKE